MPLAGSENILLSPSAHEFFANAINAIVVMILPAKVTISYFNKLSVFMEFDG
jgi:hypothetical protein